MSTEQPKVGDKVVYVPDFGVEKHRLRPAWRARTESVALVVEEPDATGEYACRTPAGDEWYAPADRLRVVERATYERVGEVDG